jgi:hypothetical protein
LLGRAESHDVLDAGAVVPAPVEDHDLATRRKALDIALHVHLALLAIGWRRQRHDAKDSRAHALGDGLDGAALARRVAPFQHDDHALAVGADSILRVAELLLQLAQLFLVDLAFQFLRLVVARHPFFPGRHVGQTTILVRADAKAA